MSEIIYSNKYEIGNPIAINTIAGIYKGEFNDNGVIKYRISFILPGGNIQMWQFINKTDRDTAYTNIITHYGWLAD